MKGADFLRVVTDQMHQLEIVKVASMRSTPNVGDRPDRIQ